MPSPRRAMGPVLVRPLPAGRAAPTAVPATRREQGVFVPRACQSLTTTGEKTVRAPPALLGTEGRSRPSGPWVCWLLGLEHTWLSQGIPGGTLT